MKPRLLIFSAVVIATALEIYYHRSPSSETREAAQQVATSSLKPSIKAAPAASPSPTAFQSTTLTELASLGAHPEPARRLQLVEKLAAGGAGHESELAAALVGARSSIQRGIIADALARTGTSEAVDALVGLINTTKSNERADILPALDALPPGPAIETLASSLALQLDPQVRDRVIDTIARTADASIVAFLRDLYHEPEAFPGQASHILTALGSIRNPAAAIPLGELLRTSREVTIMQNAAAALGRIGNSEALQPIADTLRTIGNTNPDLRKQLLGIIQNVTTTDARDWLKSAASNRVDTDLAAAANAALNSLTVSAP